MGFFMHLGSIAFLAGAIALLQLPELPADEWSWLLVPAVALLATARRFYIPLLFLCGFLWTLWHADQILSTALSSDIEGKDIKVQGIIASIPEQRGRGQRFLFVVKQLQWHGQTLDTPGSVRLSWYGRVPELRVGDEWRLQVRLKRPNGFMNPGGFDYEAWLFQHHIRATGYVRSSRNNRRVAADPLSYPLQRLRQFLLERLTAAIGQSPHAGIVNALATGERRDITHRQWEVLTRTGTNHLVAISGLHIGLVAGLVFVMTRWIWSRCRQLAVVIPAPCMAAVFSIVAAAGYAALAGFTVPTQRALIMVTVVLLAVMLQRRRSPAHSLSLALMAVLISDPLAILSAGFWLSFSAVGVILFAMSGRLSSAGHWWKYGRLHVVIAVGLMPLMLILFQRVPLLAPLANFIAVPWVGLLVVPLVLSGSVLLMIIPMLGEWLLRLSVMALSGLWVILEKLAKLDLGQWSQHVPLTWTLLPAVIGILWLLAPRGLPARWLGLLWLLPALLVSPRRPGNGDIWFTLLDVGQGLAAVIQTRDHVLVYDTGPRFSADFDAGQAVLIPFFRYYGITRLDMLLIGHGDNDHIGGVESLHRAMAIDRVLSSVPGKFDWIKAETCHAGQHWRWEGVDFEILHPDGSGSDAGNNASCVMRIANQAGAILLSGDIERGAEKFLLQSQGSRLAADILVIPHHGSNTSSTAAFVKAVAPDYALFPLGYRNRYGFPKAAVIERYQQLGARILRTDLDGAIHFRLIAGQALYPQRYRHLTHRIWRRD